MVCQYDNQWDQTQNQSSLTPLIFLKVAILESDPIDP